MELIEPSSYQAVQRTRGSLRDRARKLGELLRETPIVPLEMEGLNLYTKLEQFNVIGSIKDRPAYYILRSAIERGEIEGGTTVVESSSGNFAIALAAFCRLLGIEFVPVIDPNITRLKECLLRTTCKRVEVVDKPDDSGGYLKSRLRRVDELRRVLPATFWTNQYGNEDGMRAHYEITGAEICRGLPNIDYLFVGVSSGGSIAGVSRRVRERFPHAQIIAVDALGSAIFGGRPHKRYIPGIGSSIVPGLLRHAVIDDVVVIPEVETAEACLALYQRYGLFVGGSSGSAYAAVRRYLPRMRAASRPDVLFLCCDSGYAYIDTIFDEGWRQWLRKQQDPEVESLSAPAASSSLQKEQLTP